MTVTLRNETFPGNSTFPAIQLNFTGSDSSRPKMILFSTHFDAHDAANFRFQLTHDEFTNFDIRRVKSIHCDDRAFFFLNCCRTGDIPNGGFTNVFTKLFPKYALGFIATGVNIRNSDAETFPYRFNEFFIGQNIMLIDSFMFTKIDMVFNLDSPEYGALGYMLWQVNPALDISKSLKS